MISTNDMRPGMTLDLDGDLYAILEYSHHKPGKGHAMVRTKLKNLLSGVIVDRTFRADEKVSQAIVNRRPMSFLYSDASGFVFMDSESFDQVLVDEALVGDQAKYLKEGETVQVAFYESKAFSVELPSAVELEIRETEPGVKGDRSSAGTKPAILETGASVQVPLFVDIGEIVRVDTRTGQYVTRVR